MSDSLHTGSDATVFFCLFEELSALLAHGCWQGTRILEFFTQMFDCPEVFQPHYRKKSIDLYQPMPTILSATTPEWFWKYAQPSDFHGGFGNRFAFLREPEKPRFLHPSARK